jgi:hypothetical protein
MLVGVGVSVAVAVGVGVSVGVLVAVGVGVQVAVGSLRQGTLNAAQCELVQALRNGLAAFAEKEEAMQDVKVPAPVE